MVKIYKYKLDATGVTELVDRFLVPIKVAFQGNFLCLWCLVGGTNVRESRLTVYSLPTGYEFILNEDMRYLDTVQDGSFVWHIFYEMHADTCKRTEH